MTGLQIPNLLLTQFRVFRIFRILEHDPIDRRITGLIIFYEFVVFAQVLLGFGLLDFLALGRVGLFEDGNRLVFLKGE